LRRRSPQLLQTIAAAPASAWRRVELDGVSRLAHPTITLA
jgi:hypothetical protein